MSMPNAFLVSYPMQLARLATNSYRSRVFHFSGIMMAKSFHAGKSERQIIWCIQPLGASLPKWIPKHMS
jgi:hypothetical protein